MQIDLIALDGDVRNAGVADDHGTGRTRDGHDLRVVELHDEWLPGLRRGRHQREKAEDQSR